MLLSTYNILRRESRETFFFQVLLGLKAKFKTVTGSDWKPAGSSPQKPAKENKGGKGGGGGGGDGGSGKKKDKKEQKKDGGGGAGGGAGGGDKKVSHSFITMFGTQFYHECTLHVSLVGFYA